MARGPLTELHRRLPPLIIGRLQLRCRNDPSLRYMATPLHRHGGAARPLSGALVLSDRGFSQRYGVGHRIHRGIRRRRRGAGRYRGRRTGETDREQECVGNDGSFWPAVAPVAERSGAELRVKKKSSRDPFALPFSSGVYWPQGCGRYEPTM